MQHVCNGTGLRFILVGGTPHFLPRSLDGSVSSQSGILGQRRKSSQVTVRKIWTFHSWVCVDDFLMLTRSSSINRVIVLESGSRLPCFASSWSLVSGHVFLRKTLLYRLRFPVIVSYPPSVLDHPSTELAEHGFCSDDGDLPRSVRIRKYFLVY